MQRCNCNVADLNVAAFAVVSAPMLTPAKNVEAKITPKSSAAKSPRERMTLFIA
jgi:hypothetical protein